MEKPFALIVEDDRDIGALFQHVLDLAGYRTQILVHGQTAVEFLAQNAPDIVLLDLGLPGITGTEILQFIRADERLRKIPVVVITAHPHLAESLPVAPQLVLIKPVNIEQMSKLIQRICPTEQTMGTLPWDVLTGVYNRSFFLARLGYALGRAKQLPQTKFAVLYLNLEYPTTSNFLFGKEYDKRVLKESAKLLKTILRPSDTIARLEGDIFVVLVEDVKNHETPILITSRVQNRIRKYLAKTESELRVQANVGVILCGAEYASVDEVLHDAEEALRLAKSDRKKMIRVLRSKPISEVTNASTTPVVR